MICWLHSAERYVWNDWVTNQTQCWIHSVNYISKDSKPKSHKPSGRVREREGNGSGREVRMGMEIDKG